ncbi:MAG: CDP-glycerol glycerophosphotransferase family protein [Chloroflexi bacterium]|nr:CDP-glycerol glycerophosphotransferase family protein [Chloroflexota bacterium]
MQIPKVIVLAFSKTSKALSAIARETQAGAQVIVVSKDGEIPQGWQGKVAARRFEDYLTPEENDRINEGTMKFVARGLDYFRSHPELAPAHRGIPLWDIIHWPAFKLYVEVEKYATITDNLIRQERPQKIVIVAAPGDLMFWYDIEAVIQSGRMRKLASWLINSGGGTLADCTVGQVARSRGIPVSTIPASGPLWSHLGRFFALHLFPSLYRLFVRYAESRKRRLADPVEPGAGSANRPICLVTHSRGHVRVIAPIARQLLAEGHQALVVNVDGQLYYPARRALLAEGLAFKSYERYMTRDACYNTGVGAEKMLALWRKLEKDEAFLKSLDYRRLPLAEMARDRLYYMFALLFPEVIKHIERACNIIDMERPGAIVLVDDSSLMERSLALVARARSVPTIQTSFGLYVNLSVVGSIDRTAAWGQAVKDFLIEHGLAPADSIEITGDPGSEAAKKQVDGLAREDILARLNIAPDKKVVLFTSQAVQPPPVTVELRERLLRCVYNAIKELPDLHFIVKLHPGEGFDRHNQLRSEMALGNITVVKEWDLYELLKVCDVLISFHSGTAIEAMIMDKPVIAVKFSGRSDILPYAEKGAALGVTREQELVPAIQQVLLDDDVRQRLAAARAQFVLDYAGPQDGLAARRVADLALRMAQQSTGQRPCSARTGLS